MTIRWILALFAVLLVATGCPKKDEDEDKADKETKAETAEETEADEETEPEETKAEETADTSDKIGCKSVNDCSQKQCCTDGVKTFCGEQFNCPARSRFVCNSNTQCGKDFTCVRESGLANVRSCRKKAATPEPEPKPDPLPAAKPVPPRIPIFKGPAPKKKIPPARRR